MHFAAEGAYTGEPRPPYAGRARRHARDPRSFGATSVLLPRNDADLARKVRAALDAGLTPCVLRRDARRARGGRTEAKVGGQLDADLAEVEAGRAARRRDRLPGRSWAIGTGRTRPRDRPGDGRFIRRRLGERSAPPPTRCASSYGGTSRRRTSTAHGAIRHRRRVVGGPASTRGVRAPSCASWSPREGDGEGGAVERDAPNAALSPAGACTARSSSSSWTVGQAPDGPGNAVALARTPVFRPPVGGAPQRHARRAPARRSGCRRGRWGNSEVGHLNIVAAVSSIRI